jgi:hypothetical protein
MMMSRTRALLYLAALVILAGGLYLLWPRSARERGEEKARGSKGRVGAATISPGLTVGAGGRSATGVSVGGTIRESDSQQPVSGVTLTFRTTLFEVSAVSADQGTYRLEVPPGVYEISLAATGHVGTLPRPSVRIEESSPISWLNFTVHRTATVAGRVVGPGGNPVSGATVQVNRARGAYSFDAGAGRSVTDGMGRFTLTIPPAEVLLQADAGKLGSTLSRPLYARSGTHLTGVEILIGGGSSLSGRVLAPGGRAVSESARVLLQDDLGIRNVPCDPSGSFAVGGLTPGTKYLQAAAKGFAPGQVTRLELQPNAALNVVLQVGSSQGAGGKVVSQDDLPVAGARVTARPASPGSQLLQLLPPQEVVTTADGSFSFTDLPALPIEISAHGPGNLVVTRSGVPVGSYNLVLKLQLTGSISGQVTDGLSGKPVRDFTVKLTEGPGAGDRATLRVVSASGQYTLEDLLPGSYGLAFAAPGYGAATSGGVSVVAGYSARASAVLDAGGAVAGLVVDERGVGIPGASARMDSGWSGEPVITDASGRFLIKDVARGNRSLAVTHPEYDSKISGGVSVFAGHVAQVRVELTRRAGKSAGLSLTGIGTVISKQRGQLVVLKPLPGSPADVAGIRAGDVVLTIDSTSAERMGISEAMEAMRGIPGTPVRLRLKRAEQTFEVDIIRATVNVPGQG